MRRLAGMLAALALAGAGCGGGPSAEEVLSETASNLAEIESGKLSLRLLVEGRGGAGEGIFGFELKGPFSLAAPGSLPVARVDYTQIAGPERATVTLVSTGRKAFVVVAGRTYALPLRQLEELRGARGELRAGSGLEELRIDDWIESPKLADGGEVGGAETDRVRARLDVVQAVNDLLELARGLGADTAARIDGESARQLERAVESGSIEVLTGKGDRLLRRLTIDAEFGFGVPQVLRGQLGDLVGARVTFELGVSDPNEPVSVPEPSGVRPYSELPGS